MTENLKANWFGFRADALSTSLEILNIRDILLSDAKIQASALTLGTALGICIGTGGLFNEFAVGKAAFELLQDLQSNNELMARCSTLAGLLQKLVDDIEQ